MSEPMVEPEAVEPKVATDDPVGVEDTAKAVAAIIEGKTPPGTVVSIAGRVVRVVLPGGP